ncbi:MAG TPA: hypothetical protein VF748_15080 [Candidatus Acidoferrum sp.]
MPGFGNVVLPDVTSDQMRGVWALLDLIATPRSQEAQDFLEQLIAVKAAAVEAQVKAAADREAADRINTDLGIREAAARRLKDDADKLMAEAKVLKAQLDTKHAEYMRIFGGR